MSALVPFARRLARPGVRLAREVPHWQQVVGVSRQRGRKRRVALLPARGPDDGASRLRIYAMAPELRALGWSTLLVDWKLTLRQRLRLLKAFRPDVILMQTARHSLNRPAFYPEWPVVYDMDDADFHLPHLSSAVREDVAHARSVVAGSRYVADWCRQIGVRFVQVIWTGSPPSRKPRIPHDQRPLCVAWAQTRPETYQRELALVARAMADVAAARPDVTLRLYDRQPGQGEAILTPFRAAGLRVEWRAPMSYEAYLASFDTVSLGLAPLCPDELFSRGKSFGKVLGYLDRMVPVVGSAVGDYPAFFSSQTGVITNDTECWPHHILRLLQSPGERQAMSNDALAAFQCRLTSQAAAVRLHSALVQATDGTVVIDASCRLA